jgi:hypothetical protein
MGSRKSTKVKKLCTAKGPAHLGTPSCELLPGHDGAHIGKGGSAAVVPDHRWQWCDPEPMPWEAKP